jgi:hypothetical protein
VRDQQQDDREAAEKIRQVACAAGASLSLLIDSNTFSESQSDVNLAAADYIVLNDGDIEEWEKMDEAKGKCVSMEWVKMCLVMGALQDVGR